jgi:hypothetical protein
MTVEACRRNEVISEVMRDKIAARHDGELVNVARTAQLIPLWGDVSGSHLGAMLGAEHAISGTWRRAQSEYQ